MKILVLGGTSFFGKELANLLAEQGHLVSVFSRKAPTEGLSLDIKQIKGDRTIDIDLSRISLNNWDIVFDNICYTKEDAIKAVKKFSGKTGLYIFTSSEAVYYLIEELSSPFRENHTEIFKDKIKFKNGKFYDYAKGKYEAEQVFLNAFLEEKFPISIMRLPIVIGPNDNTLRAYSYWLRIADGYPFFAPGLGFSKRFIYSKDLVDFFYKISQEPDKILGKIYNLGDEEVISLNDFLKISAKIIGKPLLIAPADFSWLKEKGFDMNSSPFSSKKDYIIDIDKFKNNFLIKSTPIEKWLEKTIEWYFFKYTGLRPENYKNRKKEIELSEIYFKEGNENDNK